jgi:hypothetical protein
MAASLTTAHSDDFRVYSKPQAGTAGFHSHNHHWRFPMPILLWLLGVPLSLIIILLLFHVI